MDDLIIILTMVYILKDTTKFAEVFDQFIFSSQA